MRSIFASGMDQLDRSRASSLFLGILLESESKHSDVDKITSLFLSLSLSFLFVLFLILYYASTFLGTFSYVSVLNLATSFAQIAHQKGGGVGGCSPMFDNANR